MAKVREIKRRIKSVDNTKQITRAMEMVATSKIKKAQSKIQGLRPYSEKLKNLLLAIINSDSSIMDPLIEQREINNIALISVTADRGLCGAFNSSILKITERYIAEKTAEGKNVRLITVGKKAKGYFKYTGLEMDKSYTGISDTPTVDAARSMTQYIADLYVNKEIDNAIIIYNRFFSAMDQKPVIDDVLPIMPDSDVEQQEIEYIIEPAPKHIFKEILRTHLETMVFKALVDSAASEHASRRKAMKAATDNAQEMIDNLTRTYNRARQALITQEIAEIVGGAEALEHS